MTRGSTILDRQLVFVTGKGGVGKTTVAAAIGRSAAVGGRRTIVCEVGGQRRLAAILGGDGSHGSAEEREVSLGDGLWTMSIDPDVAVREWVQRQLRSGALTGALTKSNIFQYFVAAAPGARELATIVKLWELTQDARWKKGDQPYDTVVCDLPASGHGIGLLRTARTFADIARVGPVGSQARAVQKVIEDASRSSLIAVALPSELPVTETLELEARAGEALRRPVDAIVANAVLPSRWTADDLGAIDALDGALPTYARRAAHSEAGRARVQQSQLRRLRKESTSAIVTLPHVPSAPLGADDVVALGAELERKLAA